MNGPQIVPEETSTVSEKQFVNFRGTVVQKKGVRKLPENISSFRAFISFLSLSWVNPNKISKHNMRQMLIDENVNVSLVGALFSTISIPCMIDINAYDDWITWHIGVYGILINLASAGLVTSVLSSVFTLIAISQTTTDVELERYVYSLGRWLKMPVFALFFGLGFLGGLSMPFFCYVNFELYWFISIALSAYFLSFAFLVPYFTKLVKTLYQSKGGRVGMLFASKSEIRKAVKFYLNKLKPRQMIETISLDDIEEMLLAEANCCEFFDISQRKIATIFEEELKDILGTEYEKEHLER